MRSSLPFDDPRMPRFGVVGLLNTALGDAVILAGLALGLADIISNAAGPSLGFFLNRQWIFSHADGFRPGAVAKWPGAAI